MNTVAQSDVFFFISSIGFVFLWILIGIFLIYLIRIMHIFSRIMNKAEKDIDRLGATTKEMVEEIQDSMIYRFIFGKKKHHRKSIK